MAQVAAAHAPIKTGPGRQGVQMFQELAADAPVAKGRPHIRVPDEDDILDRLGPHHAGQLATLLHSPKNHAGGSTCAFNSASGM